MTTQHYPRVVFRSLFLLATIVAIGAGLATWKNATAEVAAAAATNTPEPVEVVTAAVATERMHRGSTTSIGTILATRSVRLRNELPGTVRDARLVPGAIVEPGAILVALDVSVEDAELKALQARVDLGETTLARLQRLAERGAVSAIELDRARAERDIARADMERIRAVIERKTIRAPFRARVGIADVHPGQFLDAGTFLTTLQGVDDAAHVDFAVAQNVGAGLRSGDVVRVAVGMDERVTFSARIVAVDARVDPATRNAMVRARVERVGQHLTPGASVRVRVPVGAETTAVMIPVSALRKGPAGDHVFTLIAGDAGETRAHVRSVTAGPVLGDDVVILSGLEAGERVATAGSFKLREAVLVQVTAEGGSPQ